MDRPMKSKAILIQVERRILSIRGQNVMLDFDLAEIYGVETRALKQAVRRNLDRFPADFMFELSPAEVKTLVSQTVIPTRGKLGGATRLLCGQSGSFRLFYLTHPSLISETLSRKSVADIQGRVGETPRDCRRNILFQSPA